MTKKEFIKVVVVLNSAYGTDMSEVQIETYYNFLKEYKTEDVVNAVSSIIKSDTREYMPRIGHIVNEIAKTLYPCQPYEEFYKEVEHACKYYIISEEMSPLTKRLFDVYTLYGIIDMSHIDYEITLRQFYKTQSELWRVSSVKKIPYKINKNLSYSFTDQKLLGENTTKQFNKRVVL